MNMQTLAERIADQFFNVPNRAPADSFVMMRGMNHPAGRGGDREVFVSLVLAAMVEAEAFSGTGGGLPASL